MKYKIFFIIITLFFVNFVCAEIENFEKWSNLFKEKEVVKSLGIVMDQEVFSAPEIKKTKAPEIGIYWLVVNLSSVAKNAIKEETKQNISFISVPVIQSKMTFPGDLEIGTKFIPFGLFPGVQTIGLRVKYNWKYKNLFLGSLITNFNILKTNWNWEISNFSCKGTIGKKLNIFTPYIGIGFIRTSPLLKTFMSKTIVSAQDYLFIAGLKIECFSNFDLLLQANNQSFGTGINFKFQ
ncbi:MAG: hypothetical protein ABIB46_05600 [bacterium]